MLRFASMIVFATLTMTGCQAMKPEDFAERTPRLVLEDYFTGETRAWGIFEDRFGRLRSEFIVDISGTRDNERLVLDERFIYADGKRERRVWRITRVDDNSYRGEADDVVGGATGRAFGNALNWRYALDLKVGERTWRVDFDDWMYLQPDGVLINRARISKWGVTVGSVTLFFRKVEATSATEASLKRAMSPV